MFFKRKKIKVEKFIWIGHQIFKITEYYYENPIERFIRKFKEKKFFDKDSDISRE